MSHTTGTLVSFFSFFYLSISACYSIWAVVTGTDRIFYVFKHTLVNVIRVLGWGLLWFKCSFMFVKKREWIFFVLYCTWLHHKHLCMNWIFLICTKISCDIFCVSVSRKAVSITGIFSPSAFSARTAVVSGKKSLAPQSSRKSAQKYFYPILMDNFTSTLTTINLLWNAQ